MTRGSKTPKCTCPAYPFPHRMGSGKCEKKDQSKEKKDATDKAPRTR